MAFDRKNKQKPVKNRKPRPLNNTIWKFISKVHSLSLIKLLCNSHWSNQSPKSYEPTDKCTHHNIIPGYISRVSLHENPSEEIEEKKTKSSRVYCRGNHSNSLFVLRNNFRRYLIIIFFSHQNFYTKWKELTGRLQHNISIYFDERTWLFLAHVEFHDVQRFAYFLTSFRDPIKVSFVQLFFVNSACFPTNVWLMRS